MKKIRLIAALALLASWGFAWGQSNLETLDIANFRAPIRADGQLFQNATYTLGGLEFPKVNVNRKYISYTAQLWMSGHDQGGTLRVAANTYGQFGGEGFHYGQAGISDTALNKAWKISKAEILLFQTDFANGTINFSNYPTIQNWPAFVTDDLGATQPYAPFVDVDGDPQSYDPNAGDYPDIPGDQAIFFAFTDDSHGAVHPFDSLMQISVKAFAYAYDCSNLSNVLFMKYVITNTTSHTYNDFKVGMWHDADLGNYADDATGTDTIGAMPMTYFYNGDALDETNTGYGSYPPAIGMAFTEITPSGSMYYLNDFSTMGNPTVAVDYDLLLQSRWLDGRHLTYGADGHDTLAGNTDFYYTGDAGYCPGTAPLGWISPGPGTQMDARSILSSEPILFAPGEVAELNMVFMMARDTTNQHLGSVCALRSLRDSVAAFVLGGQSPCLPTTGTLHPDAYFRAVAFPNPAASACQVLFANPDKQEVLLQLSDLHGRQVTPHMKTTESVANLDLQLLPAGMYLCKLSRGDLQSTIRIVRQ